MSTSSESSQLSELFSCFSSQSSTTTIRTFSGLQPSHSAGFGVDDGTVGAAVTLGGIGNGHGITCPPGVMCTCGRLSGAWEWICGTGMLGIWTLGIWTLGIWTLGNGMLGNWGRAGNWNDPMPLRISSVRSSTVVSQKSRVVLVCPMTGLIDTMLMLRTAKAKIDLKAAIVRWMLEMLETWTDFDWEISETYMRRRSARAVRFSTFHEILFSLSSHSPPQARQLSDNWKIFHIRRLKWYAHAIDIVIKQHTQHKSSVDIPRQAAYTLATRQWPLKAACVIIVAVWLRSG